jgi:pimeloyl-ACP methyl ester carboxylesterase
MRRKRSFGNWHLKFLQKISVPHEEATVDTTFGKTHALIAGPPDAPPLVLLHGALASSAHVLPEIAPLLATRRVYAIDVIGQSAMSQDRRIELKDDSYGRWLVEATGLWDLKNTIFTASVGADLSRFVRRLRLRNA